MTLWQAIECLMRAQGATHLARALLHIACALRVCRLYRYGAWAAVRAGSAAQYALQQMERLEKLA